MSRLEHGAWSGVLFKKLLVAEIVKKFFAFYETRLFITVFTRAPPTIPVLNQMYWVDTLAPCFIKIHF
jgi:hypothetical protein